jgi:hypothetical protein
VALAARVVITPIQGGKPSLSEIGCGHTQDGGDHGRSNAGDAISPDTFFIFGLPIGIVAHLLVEAVFDIPRHREWKRRTAGIAAARHRVRQRRQAGALRLLA